MEFRTFKEAIHKQFNLMQKKTLFYVNIDRDKVWDFYLMGFAKDSNPMFRKRTEHDCSCCKSFIRTAGGIVAIVDDKIMSIWDIKIGGEYQVVADCLSAYVKSLPIENVFLHYEKKIGTDFNLELKEDYPTKRWEHFDIDLPKEVVKRKDEIGPIQSDMRSTKDVFLRSLEEITIDAIETVLELIDQKSIYKGDENRHAVSDFYNYKRTFDDLRDTTKELFVWQILSRASKSVLKIRSTAIGTLLVDLSEGKELNVAVKSFESIVAPQNYKRTTALVSKRQIEDAEKKVVELGLESALQRRFAVVEDIKINNVLWADREAKKKMNAFDKMKTEVPENLKAFDKVDEVSIEIFIHRIMPTATKLELMFENSHSQNMFSLIAPVDVDSKHMFKWDNNFSYAYINDVTDSMKERVKKLGGNVEGVLRFSIQWNDGDNNRNDFDAHCKEPGNNLIDYRNKRGHSSSGTLDVDIQNPGNKVAVENIIHTNINKMPVGDYEFLVHNFKHNGGKTGFTAEIEYDGIIRSYSYNKELRQGQKISVATIHLSEDKKFNIVKEIPSSVASKEVWGINTQKFHKISMVMNSPNYWDVQAVGNKHYFFVLDNCINPEKARGFFNEFMTEDLREYRKVFEILGSKMKTDLSTNQLSGLGFSSTQRKSVLCKVYGSFERVIKILF